MCSFYIFSNWNLLPTLDDGNFLVVLLLMFVLNKKITEASISPGWSMPWPHQVQQWRSTEAAEPCIPEQWSCPKHWKNKT